MSEIVISIRKKIRTRRLAGNIINLLVVTFFAAIIALPLIFVISNAFKPLDELYLFPPRFFVINPTMRNIRNIFTLLNNSWVPIWRYLFNTVFITAAGTIGQIFVASMAAYVLEKHRFYGRTFFFSLVIAALMFSPAVTSIPNFIIMSKLHFVDSYFSLIIPAIGAPLGLFLMKQFMATVHDSLLEAAKIDGAGEFYLLIKIVMPIVKPAWLTLLIFSTQSLWNNTGGIFITSEQLKPLSYVLSQLAGNNIARAGAGAAVGLLLMIVPIVIFMFAQSNILDTMATSGLKE